MSIEENGYTNGENGEGASREDSTAEHSFDELARGVSTGTVPRRKALRMLAASLFGGVFVAAPAVAVAAPKPGGTGCSVAGQVRRNGQCVCPRGTTVCGTGSNARCVNDQCGTTSTFNPTTCQCEAVNQCGTTEVLCGGQCLAECSGGKVRNPTSCACECPSDPCPATGQTRDANCQCVCGNNEVLCGGQCLAECGSGEFRNPTTCACEAACTGGTVLCGGQCMAECSGGRVRNATTCACECPQGEALCNEQCLSITCPGTGGELRDPVTCECVECDPGQVFCQGQCRPECGGGQVRNAATCACECPQGEVFCGQTGNERCVSNQCGSGGRTFNPATCQCECPPTQPVTCGGQCRAECPSGQLRDPVTCQCVARCSAANCEGCCGTDASGAAICRRGTTNANCGSNGGACTQCTGSATCDQSGTTNRCCIAVGTELPAGQTCTRTGTTGNAGTNALCCSGNCNVSNRKCT